MKKWICKGREALKGCGPSLSNNKGETIVEVMVAFVVLLLYLVAMTTMITASLRMTSLSTSNANRLQEQIMNPIILGEYVLDEEELGKITFSNLEYNISTSHEIRFNNEGKISGFVPLVEP